MLRFLLKPIVFGVLILSTVAVGWAQGGFTFSENKGQWPEQVLYRTVAGNSTVFTEADGITYVVWSGAPHELHGKPDAHFDPAKFVMQAYKMRLVNGKAQSHHGEQTFPHHENYFKGNDPAKWGSNVGVHQGVHLHSVYPGIDLQFTGGLVMKYEFHLQANADHSLLQLDYEGQNKLHLNDRGDLIVTTIAGEMLEEAPYAYQHIDGEIVEVPCAFKIIGSTVSFAFPNGYDNKYPLVIDPVLSFASYTGSTGNNFGSTATYDNSGHLYGGGTAFAAGYPTTLGVVQNAFAGGDIDMGITKWSLDGSALEWSTYIGGNASEMPHSLVVNSSDELYVLGTSGSTNYPMTISAYDGNFNAGTNVSYVGGYGFSHTQGCDLVVSRLSSTGNALLSSTYLGGTAIGNDGVNDAALLFHNYGDVFRGEVALDPQERPVIATTTQTPGMAVTLNAAQPIYGGGSQDGYLCRLNADLSTLEYATFVGGPGNDACYGIQFDSNGNIFVTGGTDGGGMPMVGSPFDASFNGLVDPFIMKYDPTAGTLLGSTYLGTSDYDQSYFVQIDVSDDVYVLGQTEGTYPISPGVFNEPNSGQFIHKLNNNLSTSIWSTVVGTGNGSVDFSPTAFLVSNCGQIYVAGWGSPIQLGTLSTTGLTVTPDAVQPTTTGGDLYLMLLGQNANALIYATFFGGNTSTEHVDGGTSRFDKDGNVYHAVCAGCGGNNDFPTTPGAYSATNGASCNLGVLKFNLSQATAQIGINGPTYLCLPNGAQFNNTSIGGSGYLWDFGDLTTSTDSAPFHTYADTGTYFVSMILQDTTGCLLPDTAFITLNVYDPLDSEITPPDTVCAGAVVQLLATGGFDYQWAPTTGLSDPTIANPTATINATITYSVTVTDSCGTDTVSTTMTVSTPSANAGPDLAICAGDSVQLQGTNGVNLSWSPPTGLSNPTIATPMASPADTTTYVLQVTDGTGCVALDSLVVSVQAGPPVPVTSDTVTCLGEPVQLLVSGGDTYSWNPSADLSVTNIPNPVATPTASATYIVTLTNLCGSVSDSVFVLVPIVVANAWPNDTICPGESIPIFASGGLTYLWDPTGTVQDPTSASTVATPTAPTTYTVTATDQYGCSDQAQLFIELFPQPTVNAGADVQLDFGGSGQLNGSGMGNLLWSPDTAISCLNCPSPIVNPMTSTTYTLTVTDENGCIAKDFVEVYLEGTLYVPNTFTPDGDGVNDFFRAYATEVREFEILVFNRWGELLWEGNNINAFWDGTYKGTLSQIDTYVWTVRMTELNGRKRSAKGHVNLLR